MAVTQTTITGPVYLANGLSPDSASISFELSSWDAEVGEAVFATGPYVSPLDVNGNFSVDLFTSTSGVNQVVYHVNVSYLQNNGEFKRDRLGTIALAGPGPYKLSDLAFIDESTTSSFDVIAACEAYKTSAAASETNAAASEAVALAAEASAIAAAASVAIKHVNSTTEMAALDGAVNRTAVLNAGYASGVFVAGLTSSMSANEQSVAAIDNAALRGIYVISGLYTFKRVGTGINPDWFGGDPTGVANASPAWQAAVTIAKSYSWKAAVTPSAGKYLINTTISVDAGFVSIQGPGCTNLVLVPGMADGTAVIEATNDIDNFVFSGFAIHGNIVDANFDSGAANAIDCIGIKAVSTKAPGFIARYALANLDIRGCKTGMNLSGFICSGHDILITRCETGFNGDLLNASTFRGLQIEACRKSFIITDSDGLTFDGFIAEGSISGEVASTIDECNGVTFLSPYFECSSGYPRTQPFIKIGETTQCNQISLINMSMSGSSGMAAGVRTIEVDQVDGGLISGRVAEGSQSGLIGTTANTRNFKQDLFTEFYHGIQDEAGIYQVPLNYFPDRTLSGPKGYKDVYPLRTTVAPETTNFQSGTQAIKVTCEAGAGFNIWVQRLPDEVFNALKGKTVRVLAKVYIPDTAAFQVATRTAFPAISLTSYNGSVAVSSPTKNSIFLPGQWQFLYNEVTVQTDCTQLEVISYVNQSANVVTVAEYIIVDSIVIVDEAVPLQVAMEGAMADAPECPSIVQGRMVSFGDSAPSDVDQTYSLGDQVWRRTPVASTSMGWVCTVAGSPGTWKTMPVLGA